jgi:hypothetical protein
MGILTFLIIFLLIRRFYKPPLRPLAKTREVTESWQSIEKLMDFSKVPKAAKKDTNYKLAVIEADQLLISVLKKFNFKAGSPTELLDLASIKYPIIKSLHWTHRVALLSKNDPAYTVKFGLARKILTLYKKALKKLGAL